MPKPQRDRSPDQQLHPPNTPAQLARERPDGSRVAAVARYESGMRALQEHRFGEAADAFRTVLLQYPDEKELNDRARTYLSICDRHLSQAPEPRTIEERLYAATLALNAGDRPTAMRHLREIVNQDPSHDGALYMLGVAHALADDRDQALSFLQQAIAHNPANRALALQDADLERLMQDEAIRTTLQRAGAHPTSEAGADMRNPPRHRPIR
jgi:tetratricopeptide (TPR) repeat protein